MKTRVLIIILLTFSIVVPVTSFAEQPIKIEEDFQKGTIEWISRCNMIGSAITVMVRDSVILTNL